MEYNTITFEETEPGIGLITLNRPERLNATNVEMLDDLNALFGELRQRAEVRTIFNPKDNSESSHSVFSDSKR
ncbi:MAG: enoyl-CoA hydratase/isomerase family protein [Proteobacteria bacterium]|nr:enoyl-CoA hydratase/isomerase family protein [Pseudomonadota bacterium]